MIKESILPIENLTKEKSTRNILKIMALASCIGTNIFGFLDRVVVYPADSPEVKMGVGLMVISLIAAGVFEKIHDRRMKFIDNQIKAMNENNSPDTKGTEL